MKKFLQSYFGFTKKELNGILVLCLLLMLIITFPAIYDQFAEPEVYEFKTFDKEVRQFLASSNKTNSYQGNTRQEKLINPEISYFDFDPNDLDDISWRKLGLSARQISVIRNYEAKGGRFYKKTDLKKIYSISARKYQELEPYIVIRNSKRLSGHVSYDQIRYVPSIRKDSQVMIELNAADSVELETIKGIGPAFASRIIRYRTRLGGFFRKEQLRDVYGVDSLKYAELKDQVMVDPALVQKININKASFEELRKHPYLTFKQMNAIIQYRKQHGDYRSIEDLRKIAILNDEILRKIEPYLIFNDPNQT
ncbi:hypothetical protein GZH53_04985 [Flavihumibacter sp. R14]|nr:hypothetical protein [Flavihumibacter soli]